MFEIFGVPLVALTGQIMLGIVNGAFYAVLSLGLAIIFGIVKVVNFAHGAFFMMGAFISFLLLSHLGIGFWGAIFVAPLIVGAIGIVVERVLLRRIYGLDPIYGLLLTFGLVLVIEGILPFLMPARWQRMLGGIAELGVRQIRLAGLASMLIGTLCLYLVR